MSAAAPAAIEEAKQMIYTLTTNPAIDMNLTGRGIAPNCVNRTGNVVYSPNGKGVNVSLVLEHFGIESKALGFFGGFTGKYIIEELQQRHVAAFPIWVEDTTRVNIFINDGIDEYKFVNPGSFVPQEKQQDFINLLRAFTDCEHLVISGSLPPGIATDYYDKILHTCEKKGTRCILDISSPKLKDLLRYKPLLIKPNDDELAAIFGLTTESEADILVALRKLHGLGAQNILLTLGERGSYFSNGSEVYACGIQPVKLVSSACAGDAALGAFLSAWLQGEGIETALKKSAAAGANVAESDALGTMDKVPVYMKNIHVRKVDL
jgi:1-phosphofructokinase